MLRRILKGSLEMGLDWLDRVETERSGQYGTLDPIRDSNQAKKRTFLRVVQDPGAAARPHYAWGVVEGVYLARALGIDRMSAIEFGVAGGHGLVALERTARRVAEACGVSIDVYGFDTGAGLPRPVDYRDLPNLFSEGTFVMDPEAVRARLDRATLILGNLGDTLEDFLRSRPAPVGFASVDVDLYSSTVDALRLFDADYDRLLPRVYCHFDDILGHTFSEFTGERLAIAEFNASHHVHKISPLFGLRHFVPLRYRFAYWTEMLFIAHMFEHPLYGRQAR